MCFIVYKKACKAKHTPPPPPKMVKHAFDHLLFDITSELDGDEEVFELENRSLTRKILDLFPYHLQVCLNHVYNNHYGNYRFKNVHTKIRKSLPYSRLEWPS